MAKRVDYIVMAEMLDSGCTYREIMLRIECSQISIYRFALRTLRREPVWADMNRKIPTPVRVAKFNADKVELIRSQIATGTYSFRAEPIADALIGFGFMPN